MTATFATPEELAGLMQRDLDRYTAELVLRLIESDLVYATRVPAADLPDWAATLGLTAAARLYSNPAGLTSEALDDYRRGMDGGGYLTADERDRLVGVAGADVAFSITPYGTTYVAEAGSSLDDWDVIP